MLNVEWWNYMKLDTKNGKVKLLYKIWAGYFQKQSQKERIHEKQTLVPSSGCTNVRDGIGSVRNGLLCV